MKKQTKVLLASALLALGASFTAMAAENGTWVLESDGWYCYDEDGDAYTEEFCYSYGTEYYMDEDGLLASSVWVDDYDEYVYYIGSDGSKTKNAWKLLVPFDDDEADEEWYYFDAKGHMVKEKRLNLGENWYYFDEDGRMLTGWVEYAKDVITTAATTSTDPERLVYVNEDGSRASEMWLEDYGPGLDEDDDNLDEDDLHWYYIDEKGKITTGDEDIDGLTYLFNEYGVMQTGWVAVNEDGNYQTIETAHSNYDEVYFVDDADTGYVRTGWRLLPQASEWEDREDEDPTTYWFYFNKNGKLYMPECATESDATLNVTPITFANGENAGTYETTFTAGNAYKAEIKKINSKEYLFDINGKMKPGLVKIGDEMYYFGKKAVGCKQTGNVSITDDEDETFEFYFAEKNEDDYVKATAVTGNADGYLYEDGILIKADEKGEYRLEETSAGTFIVNQAGKIQHKENKGYELETGYTITVTEFEDAEGTTENSVVTYTLTKTK